MIPSVIIVRLPTASKNSQSQHCSYATESAFHLHFRFALKTNNTHINLRPLHNGVRVSAPSFPTTRPDRLYDRGRAVGWALPLARKYQSPNSASSVKTRLRTFLGFILPRFCFSVIVIPSLSNFLNSLMSSGWLLYSYNLISFLSSLSAFWFLENS